MQRPDPYAHDPFFRRGPNRTWNACIGRQGDEHNYVIGYMQAATELVAAVLDKQMAGKRDTLVLPILYNARHAIELALKFAARRLVEEGLATGPVRANHAIEPLWRMLDAAKLGDRQLLATIAAIKPFVESVTAIDQDGQELRYHRNNLDDPSLEKFSIASLEVIRAGLAELEPLVDQLQFRTLEFLNERTTGTYTSRCSRSDLFAIAEILPPLAEWKDAAFDQAKAKICADFSLSGRAFSDALDIIKGHREMRAMLGGESPFKFLSDGLVLECFAEWRKWHQPHHGDEVVMVRAKDITFEMIMADSEIETAVVGAIRKLLTPDQFGELAAMFFLSRDRFFSECFDALIDDAKKDFLGVEDPVIQIGYLFEKTNLLSEVTRGAAMIGRLELAKALECI